MRITSSVITAFLLLSGCVGGVDDIDTPTPGTDAGTNPTAKQGKQNYIANVHAITMRCGGAGCHAQVGVTGMYGFALTDAGAAYEEIIKLPTLIGVYTEASAPFFTKIAAGHHGITYSATEKMKVNAWFAQELADRNTGGGTPPPPLVDAALKLREWSGCMKQADFNTAQMTQKWGQLAGGSMSCKGCHSQGAFAFMSGDGANAIQFFTTITTQKDLMLKYFTVDAMGQVVINNAAFQNAGVALPAGGNSNHPPFDPTTNIGMDALLAFYNLAKAHQTALTCDPPRLPM